MTKQEKLKKLAVLLKNKDFEFRLTHSNQGDTEYLVKLGEEYANFIASAILSAGYVKKSDVVIKELPFIKKDTTHAPD